MAQQTMYPGQVNSPQTELASAINDTDTTIPLLDASKLPAAPNLATIGTGEDAETILYTGVSGNDLTGVTRGFQGASKAWSAGVKVGRYFTAYDHDAFRQNIEDHETIISAATSAATASTLVQRDANGRFKAAAPSASDDVARKAETDAALSAAQAAAAVADAAQTTANAALPKAGGTITGNLEVNGALTKGGKDVITTAGGQTINGVLNAKVLVSTNSEGNEGGEINLAKPTSGTSLAGQVTIDVIGNLLRIFDSGGSARGAALDLTAQQTGVGSRIWTTAALRWNSGRLEYNDGGTWKPVGGIKSIQRGRTFTGTSGNTTTDVTIAAVDPNKCEIFLPFIAWDPDYDGEISAELISPTVLRLYHPNTTFISLMIGWQVTEHY